MFKFLNRKLVLLLAIAAITSSASALLAVTLFGMVSQSRSSILPTFDPLLYAALWLTLVAVSVSAAALLSKHSAAAVYEVRTTLIRRVLATAHDKLEQVGTARLQNVLTNDVNTIANMLADLPTFMFNAILVTCCLTYLAILSPQIFLVIAMVIGMIFLVSRALIARLARHGRALRERHDLMQEGYRGMLAGSAQLAIDATRKFFFYQNDLSSVAGKLRQDEQRFRFYGDTNRAMTSAFILLLLGVLVALSRVLANEAMIMSYTLIIIYCAGPFAGMMNLLQQFIQARIALTKIESLAIGEDQTVVPAVGAALAWRRVRLIDVAFMYKNANADEQFALGPLSLEVHKGEVLFITGGNGSGKSTLLKLLLGLRRPSAGRIMIDDMPLEWGSQQQAYQSLFSIVLSEFHLFPQVLGSDGRIANDHELRELLRMFNLQSVVEIKDGCFSTVQLSQGQRKRLALVSALAQDKDIYVLDEWAADQDPHYRKVFYREIIPWMRQKGKTVIAVTHDDRYFDAADRRIELEMGTVRREERVLADARYEHVAVG
ncbi:MAG: cyclic peptide export ABC transporter [Gammaproteobacteria bacterium]|nr:cyclic peptide export ABC transporter [Gammaproteobacteria bacterium]